MSIVTLKKGNGMSVAYLAFARKNGKTRVQFMASDLPCTNHDICPEGCRMDCPKYKEPLFVGVDPGSPKGDISVHVKEKNEGEKR